MQGVAIAGKRETIENICRLSTCSQRKRWKAREKSNGWYTFVKSFSCLVRALTGGKGRKKHVTGGKHMITCSGWQSVRQRVAAYKHRIT